MKSQWRMLRALPDVDLLWLSKMAMLDNSLYIKLTLQRQLPSMKWEHSQSLLNYVPKMTWLSGARRCLIQDITSNLWHQDNFTRMRYFMLMTWFPNNIIHAAYWKSKTSSVSSCCESAKCQSIWAEFLESSSEAAANIAASKLKSHLEPD